MKRFILISLIICFYLTAQGAQANLLPDSDSDGVPDNDEINIYHTDPKDRDTDKDGYSDWIELVSGYSPLNNKPVKLEDNDFDKDGLSDRMELNFHTNLDNPDTDGDGYKDGDEIANGYDPSQGERSVLEKRIEINTGAQELSYFLGGVRMQTYPISSGINRATPTGYFIVTKKSPKAWSPYGLWMPNWLGLDSGRIGIHELPVWPNGYVEGEDHLGRPVSHGCIRLGHKEAAFLYNWTPIGTKVFIY